MKPNHPIYIVSKGRWDSRKTARMLDRIGVPYFVVVEPAEVEAYRAALDSSHATVLVLDPAYQRDYQTCDDLGDTKGKGPGPARNFAWDHAIAAGFSWHWVLDDNIRRLYRLTGNAKTQVWAGAFFRCIEDFVGRYRNIAMAGPNYHQFVPKREKCAPFVTNTRIYSCNLIRNDAPFRWRGRYNEDTILSLDMLKAGWCTVLFNALLIDKQHTQTMNGGNTAEFYEQEGTLPKSRMLVQVHPDVSRLVWKFGRPHHLVDYRPFKVNRLARKPGVVIPDTPNDYGMRLVTLGAA